MVKNLMQLFISEIWNINWGWSFDGKTGLIISKTLGKL